MSLSSKEDLAAIAEKHEREHSDIILDIIDGTPFLDGALSSFREQRSNDPASDVYHEEYDEIEGFFLREGPVARFIGRNGYLAIIGSEGIGHVVTDNEPAHLMLDPVIRGKASLRWHPFSRISLWPDDIRQASIIDQAHLMAFIRPYGNGGHRLQGNYRIWRNMLEANK